MVYLLHRIFIITKCNSHENNAVPWKYNYCIMLSDKHKTQKLSLKGADSEMLSSYTAPSCQTEWWPCV